MILKSFIFKFFIITLTTFSFAANAADESGDPSASQACKDELSNAKDDLERIVYSSNNSTQTASTGTNNAEAQQPQDPMSQMVQAITQTQQKQAELAKQALEQNRQLDNERFKQLNDLNDKIHEFERGDYKRRQAIKDAETAMKKQKLEVSLKCHAKAEEEYNKEFDRINTLSQTSNFVVSDISRMSGTNKRMQKTLSYYKRRCMTNPATREQLEFVQSEYDSKIHNFQIAAEEIASDVSYTQGKILLVEQHMMDQKRQMAQAQAMQQAALQQQMQMQMMQSMFGMMSGASAQQQQAQSDKEFRSADETLRQWEDIMKQCRNATSNNVRVPADVYHVFAEVNEACRGDSGLRCVENSNRDSIRTPSQNSEL